MGPVMPSSHDTWNTALDLRTMMRSDRTDEESILQPEAALAITLDLDAMPSLTPAEREAAFAREAALTLITMRHSKSDEAPALDLPTQSVDPEAVRQEEALALASLTFPEAEAIARLETACALVSLAHSVDPDIGSAARRKIAPALALLLGLCCSVALVWVSRLLSFAPQAGLLSSGRQSLLSRLHGLLILTQNALRAQTVGALSMLAQSDTAY
ncbi:hypothetical protein V8E54_000387 [Elaphomyces granulatus]